MFRRKRINDVCVKPMKCADANKKPAKGWKLIPEPYANIFLCARKKSGKTSVINTLLRKCAGRNTTIIVFCSTVDKDDAWKEIRKWAKQAGIAFLAYTSITDYSESGKIDRVKDIVDELIEESKADEPEVETPVEMLPCDPIHDVEDEKAPKKSKYIAPEYILVFDDLSTQLKNKNLVSLLKMNRHFKMKTIISSQYPNDLLPESRKQIDVWILFGGHGDKKLQQIHEDSDPGIEFEDFVKLYHDATSEKYNFLYMDVRNVEFRRNFNEKYDI